MAMHRTMEPRKSGSAWARLRFSLASEDTSLTNLRAWGGDPTHQTTQVQMEQNLQTPSQLPFDIWTSCPFHESELKIRVHGPGVPTTVPLDGLHSHPPSCAMTESKCARLVV